MKALTDARRKRGWSLTKAAKELGVSEQQIRNLERIGHTRDTLPSRISVMTAVLLMETFPELDLQDFVPGTKLRLKNRRQSR